MIRSFADEDTAKIFRREPSKRFAKRTALRKLVILHAAASLADLRVPSANRLEKQ